jgi:uncharacterized protein
MQVQTCRISFSEMESWIAAADDLASIITKLKILDDILLENEISFCSLGGCSSIALIDMLPAILTVSDRFSSSARFSRSPTELSLAPDPITCLAAANASIKLFKNCGDLGNFRFCASFNMTSSTPFFPAASHPKQDPASMNKDYAVTTGLENGDLLFMAFFAVDSYEEGSKTLHKVLLQALQPIQELIDEACRDLSSENISVMSNGIDASINPGLQINDSVGAGIEHMLLPRPQVFGSFGTLAAVSAITHAVKSLPLKLTGYSGLMLPVMEDVVLSQRANEGSYRLRDLLMYSALCGVGLDTVPVPETITPEQLAAIYLEVGALAYRLNKPLSVRLLPMKGLQAGQLTNVDSPYLCNTTVFEI